MLRVKSSICQNFRASEKAREYLRRPLTGRAEDEHRIRYVGERQEAFQQLLGSFGGVRLASSHLGQRNAEHDTRLAFHRAICADQAFFALGPEHQRIESISIQGSLQNPWGRVRVLLDPLEAILDCPTVKACWRIGFDGVPRLAPAPEVEKRSLVLPLIQKWHGTANPSALIQGQCERFLETLGLSVLHEQEPPLFVAEVLQGESAETRAFSLRPLAKGVLGFDCSPLVETRLGKLVVDEEQSQIQIARKFSDGRTVQLYLRGLPFGSSRITDIPSMKEAGEFEFEYTLLREGAEFNLRSPDRTRTLYATFSSLGVLQDVLEFRGGTRNLVTQRDPLTSGQIEPYREALCKAAHFVQDNHHLFAMASFFAPLAGIALKTLRIALTQADRMGLDLDEQHPAFENNLGLLTALRKHGLRVATEKYVRAICEGSQPGILLYVPTKLQAYEVWFKFEEGVLRRCQADAKDRQFSVRTNFDLYFTNLLVQESKLGHMKRFQTQGLMTLPAVAGTPLAIMQIRNRGGNLLQEIPGMSNHDLLLKIQGILDEGEADFLQLIDVLRTGEHVDWIQAQVFDTPGLLRAAAQGLLLMHRNPNEVLPEAPY